MSTTSATKITTKAPHKPPYRTAAGEMVRRDGIIDIDGSGIDFIEGDDERGSFKPLPLIQRQRRPSHPGAILRELYLPPTGLTQTELALALGLSRRTVNMILNEKMAVSVDIAHRLSRAFGGTSLAFWLGLQRDCDIWDAAHSDATAYEHIKRLERAA